MAEIEKVIKQLQLLSTHNVAPNIMNEAIQTIRELQNQIPKWHLVADGDLPNELEDVLVIYEANIDGGTCDGEVIKSYGIGYLSNAKTNDWVFATYKSLKENPSVIAWTELPKFSEVD